MRKLFIILAICAFVAVVTGLAIRDKLAERKKRADFQRTVQEITDTGEVHSLWLKHLIREEAYVKAGASPAFMQQVAIKNLLEVEALKRDQDRRRAERKKPGLW